MAELWIASGNEGKIKEMRQLLGDRVEIHSQGELDYYSSPEETGDTFEANARIKATSLKKIKTEAWILAEDSGLEVEGLKNYPGVHSARYAGPQATDVENNAKLMKMMGLRSATNRKAQFRCVMIAISPEGEEHVFDGVIKGDIAKKMAGTAGFGYDPLFIPEGETQTMAELGLAFKAQKSHRAQALRKFLEII